MKRNTLGQFEKGIIPWNKGVKGLPPRHTQLHSEEAKQKMSKAKFGKYRNENSPHWKGGKPKCWCGKILSYGSKNCHQHRDKNTYLIGFKNPRWNPNREEVTKNERNDGEYKQWRLKVLQRDNYRCMDCGEIKKGEMEANHIFPWAKFPRLRYDINNGETLCKDCHKIKTKGERLKVYSY